MCVERGFLEQDLNVTNVMYSLPGSFPQDGTIKKEHTAFDFNTMRNPIKV